jgi:hypothetical protein
LLLRRQLHPILIMNGIFVATILNDQYFTIFGYNLHLFKLAPCWIAYTERTLYFLTICPAMTLLLFAGYLQLINWNPGFSFIRNLVDGCIVFLLLAGTRTMLRRRGVAA